MRRRRGRAIAAVLRAIAAPAVIILAMVFFTAAMGNVNAGRAEEDKRQLEETLRRAAAACFAAEGHYPQDVAYLQDHYGIQIDGDRYIVHYEIFAENLMPEITVVGIAP